jgi:hypothetical protein
MNRADGFSFFKQWSACCLETVFRNVLKSRLLADLQIRYFSFRGKISFNVICEDTMSCNCLQLFAKYDS